MRVLGGWRRAVAHRRRHYRLLPFLANSVGKPGHRLFHLLHPAGILRHRVVRRTDALLEALRTTTWRSRAWVYLLLSMLAALGATCSLANGSLLWPLLVAAALLLRLPRAGVFSLLATGIVSTACIFTITSVPWATVIQPLRSNRRSKFFGSRHILRKPMGAARRFLATGIGILGLAAAFFALLHFRTYFRVAVFPGSAGVDPGVLSGDCPHHLIRPFQFRHPAGFRLPISHIRPLVLVLPGPAAINKQAGHNKKEVPDSFLVVRIGSLGIIAWSSAYHPQRCAQPRIEDFPDQCGSDCALRRSAG